MTDWEDVSTLGIWLGLELDHAIRLRNENNSVRGAALNILGSFYRRSARSEVDKWHAITEALRELNKEGIIERMGLHEMQSREGKD